MAELADRRVELAENLRAVRARISAACAAADRPAREITLIAVTKFFPATDAALLADLGVADLGESRDQEAGPKAAAVRGLTQAPTRWHFIGQLQTNKARSVVRYADVVHSVDRLALVNSLAQAVERSGRPPLKALVQVDLDPLVGGTAAAGSQFASEAHRGGASAEEVLQVAAAIDAADSLELAGVMAVAPPSADPDDAFARLATLAAQLRAEFPTAKAISAGMSGDLEAAVRHGATHLRIGTALLGRRRPILG